MGHDFTNFENCSQVDLSKSGVPGKNILYDRGLTILLLI